MSGSISYQHVKRTFRRDTANPLPVAGYRVRLLHRCLDSQEISLVITASSSPTSTTVTATPTEPTSAGGDVLELLEFLQHDAVPYEVKAPPYSQTLGGSRGKPAKPIRAGNTSRTAPSRKAAGASKRDKNQISQRIQVQGDYIESATGDLTKNSNNSLATTATDATAAAAAAVASPVLPGQEIQLPIVQDAVYLVDSASQNTSQREPPNHDGSSTSTSSSTASIPSVLVSEKTSPRNRSKATAATAATAAVLYKPGLQLPATGTSAATTAIAATAGTPLVGSDSAARSGSPRSGSSTAGSSSRTFSNSSTDITGKTMAVSPAATVIATAGATAPAVATASATDSYLAGRRAAVLWQWKQFLGSREGPQGRAPTASQGFAPATATAAAAAAPVAAATTATTAPVTAPAAPPPGTATSPRPVMAAATANAASGTSFQTSSRKPTRPVVQAVVPGIAPPPPRDLPNAATGTAADDPEAAPEATMVPPQVARVPTALLPLTLQGRISLMEAAVAAAKETAKASARRSSTKDGPHIDLKDRGPRGIVAAVQGGHQDPPMAAARLPVIADTPAATPAVKSWEKDTNRRTDQSTAPTATAVAAAAAGSTPSGLAVSVVDDEAGSSRGSSAPPATVHKATTVAAPLPAVKISGGDRRGQLQAAVAPADPAAAALPPVVAAARDLLAKLVRYLPCSREDGPALLSPYVRYQYVRFQDAAAAATAHADLLLRPLGLQQLSYIAAAYAAAGHRHEPFLRMLTLVAADKMEAPRRARSRLAAAAAAAAAARPSSPEAPLTFRTACVMLTALARLRYHDGRLMAAMGRWLAAALRSGDVTPRAKWKGTWLAAALWAYATLEQIPARDAASGAAAGDSRSSTPTVPAAATATVTATATVAAAVPTAKTEVSAAGAVLFTEAAEAIRVDPGWIHLMDCREALWALWALKVAATIYNPAEGTAAEPAAPLVLRPLAMEVSYTPQPLVELQLLERAASQLDQLDPGQLAEAYAVAAEAGFGADRDMQAALRRCTLARIAAVRPQPLAVMVASLALLQVQDVTWLTALAAACRNQMINMKAEQILVVLHSFAVALRFYYLPLFHAAAVMCTLPGFARLEQMPAGDLVRLSAAYAAVGHYEAILMRRTAERILFLGSDATSWQRASVVHSCARLSYRSNPLLRAVATEASGLPPGPLALVAAAYGHLQFRPRGLLSALHSARVTEWQRMGLTQRAALCWSLLVLTGGLAGCDGDVRGGGGGGRSSGGGAVTAAAADFTDKASGADDGADVDVEPEDEDKATATAPTSKVSTSPSTSPGVRAGGNDSVQPQRRRWRQQQRQRQQHRQLAEALCVYLRALATTDWRAWPVSEHHHFQLLMACSVLTWREGDQQQLQALPKKEKEEGQLGGDSGGAGDIGASDNCGGAGGGDGGGGGGGGGSSDGGGRPLLRVPPAWAIMAAPLRGALRRLPAAATRRALVMHHRLRQAALGPWATQVADVVRQVLDGAMAADAATAAESGQTWLRNRIAYSNGIAAVAEAEAEAALLLRGATVTHGSLLCDGALSVDVCVEVELEMGLEMRSGDFHAPIKMLALLPVSTTESETITETETASSRALDDSVGHREGSGGGGGGSGDGIPAETVTMSTVRERRKVRIALELCAAPPPGAGAAAAATAGLGGGGVVRNSRWLVSGTAALRRRLLTGLGWHVVALRERTWQGLRSPEQQRRAVEAILRRAVLQAATGEEGERGGE